MSTRVTNKQLVLDFLAAFSEGNIDVILSMLTDDATWWTNGAVPGLSGSKAKQEFSSAIAGMADLSTTGGLPVKVLSAIADGDQVAVVARSDAEFTNGKTYKNDYVFVFEIRDSQIVKIKEYMDTELARATFLG